MTEANESILVLNQHGEEQNASLGDIAGLDMSNIEPSYGFEGLPNGIYRFRYIGGGLEVQEARKSKKEPNVKVPRTVAKNVLEVIMVKNLKSPDVDPDSLIGNEHHENFWIVDITKDFGRVIAFFQGVGLQTKANFEDLFVQAINMEFDAEIQTRTDKNDTNRTYHNINLKSMVPVELTNTDGGLSTGTDTPLNNNLTPKSEPTPTNTGTGPALFSS